ncbi:MAG: class I SAM-dependent methyltransferase [Halieaceae bacterium]
MSSIPKLSVPSSLRRGGKKSDQWEYIDGGRDLLAYTARALGRPNFANCRVLDMGCGTKFTQAIVEYDIPMGEYLGVDVYEEMINFLSDSTPTEKFSFFHINSHNDMYNPDGEKITEDTRLPIEEFSCDVICLFSVFTHLAPSDYGSMLKLMRRYANKDCQLIFSLYLDEVSNNGHGLIEQIALENGKPWKASGEPFRDAFPGRPLQWALYSRDYALQLLEGTGWEVVEICAPNEWAQHHFICRSI